MEKRIIQSKKSSESKVLQRLNAAESLGVASIWINRAKEEFESDFGKNILKKLGIPDEYEGIGHCALGYAAEPPKEAAPRKENYVYYITSSES